MKVKKELEKREIDQINSIIKGLSRYFFQLGVPVKHYPVNEFYYFVHELCLINTNWEETYLSMCLMDTWDKNNEIDFEILDSRYDVLKKERNYSKKNIPHSFFIPTDLLLGDEIVLESFTIKKVGSERQKELLLRSHKLKTELSKEEFSSLESGLVHFIEFSTDGYDFDSIRVDLYSTFHILKGIVEYSYCSWDLEPLLGGGKRQSSQFLYPTYTYFIEDEVTEIVFRDFQLKDVETNFRSKFERISHVMEKKYKETLQFFTEREGSKSKIYGLLSSCMRLYCLGIDSPYRDQSFLYFWNVLEEITLRSKNGDTNEILNRGKVLSGFSRTMFNKSLDELKGIRNDLVHQGINRVTNISLGLLRWMCDECLSNFFSQTDLFESPNDLEIFYTLSHLKKKDGQTLTRKDFETIQRFSQFFPEQ